MRKLVRFINEVLDDLEKSIESFISIKPIEIVGKISIPFQIREEAKWK